jgi:hypothetical protein
LLKDPPVFDFSLLMVAILCCAALFGGMLFFACVMTPLVFRKLPQDVAGPFLRQVFPVYYLTGAAMAFLAAAASAEVNFIACILLVVIAGSFLYARFVLMPKVNAAREDGALGSADFKRLHRRSVLVNLGQLVAVTGTLLFLIIVGPFAAMVNR